METDDGEAEDPATYGQRLDDPFKALVPGASNFQAGKAGGLGFDPPRPAPAGFPGGKPVGLSSEPGSFLVGETYDSDEEESGVALGNPGRAIGLIGVPAQEPEHEKEKAIRVGTESKLMKLLGATVASDKKKDRIRVTWAPADKQKKLSSDASLEQLLEELRVFFGLPGLAADYCLTSEPIQLAFTIPNFPTEKLRLHPFIQVPASDPSFAP